MERLFSIIIIKNLNKNFLFRERNIQQEIQCRNSPSENKREDGNRKGEKKHKLERQKRIHITRERRQRARRARLARTTSAKRTRWPKRALRDQLEMCEKRRIVANSRARLSNCLTLVNGRRRLKIDGKI